MTASAIPFGNGARPTWHRVMLAFTLVAASLLLAALPALAGPRFSGRITSINAARNLVVMQRSDGKTIRVSFRKDSSFKRLGSDATLGKFRAGDYAVVEIAGALNDDPLDGIGLFDVHTAGRAPSAAGSVNTQIQGGFPTIGGTAAPMPVASPSVAGIGAGGSRNMPFPEYTPEWKPTQPWTNIPDVPGQQMPNVLEQNAARNPAKMPKPTTPSQPVTVNAYGQQPSAFPQQTPTQTPMTATPAAANNPWVGQVMSGAPNSQQVGMPNTAAPVQTNPYGSNRYANNPYGTDPSPNGSEGGNPYTYNGPQGPQIVTIQGTIAQVDTGRRYVTVRTMTQGAQKAYTVTVPVQVQVTLGQSRRLAGLDTLKAGDYVQISGIMNIGGTVEARQLMVNK